MDWIIYQQFAIDFVKKYKCSDPRDNARQRLRMFEAIEKMRKSLTMNKETDLDVESLVDDFDLHVHINRQTFEGMISGVMNDI